MSGHQYEVRARPWHGPDSISVTIHGSHSFLMSLRVFGLGATCLLLVLQGPAATQTLTSTMISWDLDVSHNRPELAWEVETAAGIVPCRNIAVVGNERRCTIMLNRAAEQTVRVRAVVPVCDPDGPGGAPPVSPCRSPWSAPFKVPAAGSPEAAALVRAVPLGFDRFTMIGPGSGTRGWAHLAEGNPRGVLVFVIQLSATPHVKAVTYGGVAMTPVTTPRLKSTGEAMGAYAYFLGSGIPGGTQGVSVTSAGGVPWVGYAYSVNAGRDTKVLGFQAIESDKVQDPAVTLPLGGRLAFVALGGISGQNAPSGVTPLDKWSSRGEISSGTVTGFTYSYDAIGKADVSAGWKQSAENAVALAVAIGES